MNMKNIILIGTVVVLAVSSVFLTIETATTGVEIAGLEKKEASLADQKQVLDSSLLKTLSVAQLQEKSTELGFIKPADLVYVAEVEPVAKLP
jgi:cell division protein FtsL